MSIADTIVVSDQDRMEDMGSPRRVYLRPDSMEALTLRLGQVAEVAEGAQITVHADPADVAVLER